MEDGNGSILKTRNEGIALQVCGMAGSGIFWRRILTDVPPSTDSTTPNLEVDNIETGD